MIKLFVRQSNKIICEKIILLVIQLFKGIVIIINQLLRSLIEIVVMYLLLKAKVKIKKKWSNHFTLAEVKQSQIQLKVKVKHISNKKLQN